MVQCAAILTGPLREAELRRALETTVARHEVLRTTFPRPAGMRERSQVINDSLAPGWTWGSAAAEGDLDAPRHVADLMRVEAQAAFALERGPLLRALLVAAPPARALLILTAHAACADAASLLVILHELAASYGEGGPDEREDPVQYADYAEWRHELVSGRDDAAGDGREFWRQHGERRIAFPDLLFARPAEPGGPAGERRAVAVGFGAADPDRLREAAGAAGVSLAVFLEACWHALIARLTGADELVLAGWCDGRAQPDLQGAVGPYAQPVPIRSRFVDGTSFAEILDQVARARAQAAVGQDAACAEDLGSLRDDGAAGFVHLAVADRSTPGLALAAVNPSAGARLLLAARSSGAELRVELWHDPAAWDARDAGELATRFRTLALSAASDTGQKVARLALSDQAQREALLAMAAGPAPDGHAGIPVHEAFAQQARRTPADPAVAHAGAQLTYGQLNADANRLAHRLSQAGVGRGLTVGLCLDRTPALVTALLAILKAGGAYLPLNHEHPPARLAHQLSQSRTEVLVTEERLLEHLPDFAGKIVCLDRDRDQIAAGSDQDPPHAAQAADPVYVMYTSGSTGLPKGVAVTHANLANYASQMARRLTAAGAAGAGLRFGVISAISTDLGNTCIFPPLISGGCVQLISPAVAMDGAAIASELGGRALDVLKITPSHLRALLAGDDPGAALPRHWLVLGGEALSWDLVDEIRRLAPSCRIVNHYGPTETTIGCCAYDVAQRRADCASVPIGRPLAGVRAHVLDGSLEPLPVGVPGELCIAGRGVASGYVGRDAPAAGPFIADRFSPGDHGRIYRTGDRARYLRDGTIEFLGRIDDQVKIRGFRIEPGEIEAALGRHPQVRQAAVVSEPDDRGDLRLVAYLAASTEPSVEDLQVFLGRTLPDYMVPSAFSTVDSLPFTPSGKIDRRALSGLAAVQTRREAQYVAPRDAVEREIADIWAQLLGTDQVGVFDDFFTLGGHSLLATQAIMRIRRLHGDIPLRALLAAPTVADLAAVVRSAAAART